MSTDFSTQRAALRPARQKNFQRAKWLLHGAAALVWLGGLLPQMAQWSMHVDGLTYSAIARQLATQPVADWWHLHYTQSVHPNFYEHPPLGFWLLALWYRYVMANNWAEAGYTLLWAAVLFGSLSAATRRFGRLPAGGGWLACTLLMACPLTSWLFANVMLEAPLMALMALALWCFVWAAEQPTSLRVLLGGGGAGLLCAAGCLLKGPTALAALMVPPVLFVAKYPCPLRRLWLISLAAWTVVLASFLGLWLQTDAAAYLHTYWQQQVLSSMRGQRERTGSRWKVLYFLATELAAPVALVVASRLVARRPRQGVGRRATQAAVLLALLASLPVALSHKQHRWYVAASLPYFALALALAGQPAAQAVAQALAGSRRWRQRATYACGLAALAIAGLTVCQTGHVRQKGPIYAAFLLTPDRPQLPARVALCPPQIGNDYWLHAFFMRYLQASLTHDVEAEVWLLGKGCSCQPSPLCHRLGAEQASGLRLVRCPATAKALLCSPRT